MSACQEDVGSDFLGLERALGIEQQPLLGVAGQLRAGDLEKEVHRPPAGDKGVLLCESVVGVEVLLQIAYGVNREGAGTSVTQGFEKGA